MYGIAIFMTNAYIESLLSFKDRNYHYLTHDERQAIEQKIFNMRLKLIENSINTSQSTQTTQSTQSNNYNGVYNQINGHGYVPSGKNHDSGCYSMTGHFIPSSCNMDGIRFK